MPKGLEQIHKSVLSVLQAQTTGSIYKDTQYQTLNYKVLIET